ncbi:MAG: exonuclease SbcCD subunit D [Clostridia bacterium]|nr:exonuclease SbcCD subunit D [Clostridia bacterium]
MKFIHLSDLHLGKRLSEYSLIEDQQHILTEITGIIDIERPDAVIIAGDVYDKSVPSAEAVGIFDDFLSALASRKLEVFVISGNHDSPERIAFASRIMDQSGIHMSPAFGGRIEPVRLEDRFGEIFVYMLPFIKPADVRRFFEESKIESYTDAVKYAVEAMKIDSSKRNVIVAHRFVTGARRSESEEISVGGSDNVDADVFGKFDYAALGHIHSPQNCGSERIRYCGTPLKYSFSEAGDRKSVTVVELREKENVSVREVDLFPLRDMVELRGRYADLTLRSFYSGTTWQDDYTHIILTDEDDIPDAVGKLRTVYRNLMKIDYDNMRTRSNNAVTGDSEAASKTPFELFADFYELQNNQPMSEEQAEYMRELIGKTWEGGK